MKRLLFSFTLVLVVTAGSASAQIQQAGVAVGNRVRLVIVDSVDSEGYARMSARAGTIARLDENSVTLRSDNVVGRIPRAADSLPIPVNQISYGARFSGLKRHPVVGGIAGFAVGAVTGFIIASAGTGPGAMTCRDIGGSQFCSPNNEKDKRLDWAGIFGGSGVVIGAGIGYLCRTEQWTTIQLGSLRLRPGVR
jgi:hypothetical protein